jgi:hypothetical protein
VSPGYWTVVLEPFPFKEDRIAVAELRPRLEASVVALRGWYYPHVPSRPEDIEPIPHGVAAKTDWDRYHERWRFLTNGLFVHRWRFREDGTDRWRGSLHFVDSIWTMTEIWEFAKTVLRHRPNHR